MGIEIKFPVGRVVYGEPMKRTPVTDTQTKAVKQKKDGSGPLMEWSFGVIIPTKDCAEIFGVMKQASAEVFPKGVPSNFAWKAHDCNTKTDSKGVLIKDKYDCPDHYIFTLSTTAGDPQAFIYDYGSAAPGWKQVTEGIKRGDYVNVKVDVAGHPAVGAGKPGLYMNPKGIWLFKEGPAISGGAVDPNSFAPPPQQTPPAPGGNAPAAVQHAPSTPFPGAAPSTPQASGGFPGPAAPRHTDFLNGPGNDDEIPF